MTLPRATLPRAWVLQRSSHDRAFLPPAGARRTFKQVQQGFSLIELLVVIAVLSVLGLGGSFGARTLLERGRLSEAVNVIETRVNQARLDAKRLDNAVTVTFDSASPTTFEVDELLISLPQGVTVSPSVNPLVLTFDPPFGTWDGVQGSVVVRSGSTNADVFFLGVLAKAVVTR